MIGLVLLIVMSVFVIGCFWGLIVVVFIHLFTTTAVDGIPKPPLKPGKPEWFRQQR
jgi:hypothetical protein